MTLELEPTTDILAELARQKNVADHHRLCRRNRERSRECAQKLASKSLDAIVVNDVSREGIGFDSDRNAVTILTHDEVIDVPETTKWEVAQRVLDQVVRLKKKLYRSTRQPLEVRFAGFLSCTCCEAKLILFLNPSAFRCPNAIQLLIPQLRRALADRVRYYRDLGIYDFYRREAGTRAQMPVAIRAISEKQCQSQSSRLASLPRHLAVMPEIRKQHR